MDRAVLLLLGWLVAFVPSGNTRAVTLQPVALDVTAPVTLKVRLPGSPLADFELTDDPPFTLPWNASTDLGQSLGTATIEVVNGELHLDVDASMASTTGDSFGFNIALSPQGPTAVSFAVPDFGAPLTPILFTSDQVGALPAEIESWGYHALLFEFQSAFIGRVVNEDRMGETDFGSGNTGKATIWDFIPDDQVTAGGPHVSCGFSTTSTAMISVQTSFRFKAEAIRPTPLPEPGATVQLAVGVAFLALVGRRRISR